MKLKDYLDEDVAYLIGLIIGRGTINFDKDRTTILINFPFLNPYLEGFDQFSQFVTSVATGVKKRVQDLLGNNVDIETIEEENKTPEVYLRLQFKKTSLFARDIFFILNNQRDYAQFTVPPIIVDSEPEIIKEFIRGFADVAGNIRSSNRDRSGFHRVYIDILNSNWVLPVQLCYLLQEKLDVPVDNILWGHPNLRDPNVQNPDNFGWREHQIRIYANEFLKVGFYISHKQKVLKKLSQENLSNGFKGGKKCKGCSRRVRRRKHHHPEENNNSHLPPNLVGKHFDSYWEICAEMGCLKAQKCIQNLKKQRKLFP